MAKREDKRPMSAEARWTVGALIGGVAMLGMLILLLLIALALQPPTWVQIVLGIALVAGGAALTWLVATALGGTRTEETPPVTPFEDRRRPGRDRRRGNE